MASSLLPFCTAIVPRLPTLLPNQPRRLSFPAPFAPPPPSGLSGCNSSRAATAVVSATAPSGSAATVDVAPPSSPVTFRDLDADDFRHPLDKQNTLLLRAIPGLNELGKALLGPVAEQVMVLENIGTSVLVTENQLAELHHLLVEAAKILNIEAPDLYVRQNPIPNAYTLAISGRKPFIVIHTSLVELLSRRELQAVLAHELGHLKCDHGVWLTFANILTLGAYSVPGLGGWIAQNLEEQLFRWLRAAELTCDRAALLVAQDPKVLHMQMSKHKNQRRHKMTQLSLFLKISQTQYSQMDYFEAQPGSGQLPLLIHLTRHRLLLLQVCLAHHLPLIMDLGSFLHLYMNNKASFL